MLPVRRDVLNRLLAPKICTCMLFRRDRTLRQPEDCIREASRFWCGQYAWYQCRNDFGHNALIDRYYGFAELRGLEQLSTDMKNCP